MSLILKFKEHIENTFPDVFHQRLLVAISGGIDSVVLCFLLKKLNLDLVLAHCNFQLRAQESDADTFFVQQFAEKWNLPLEIIRFDTKKYASENRLNTQLAARKLRYEWFENLTQKFECAYIVTGHQADDNLETFLINLSRGTGLNGLVGIPERNGKIIRPLLPFSRVEIQQFAQENHLSWREDSSNASDCYTRNKIRHHVSPELQKIHPDFLNNFIKTQQILQQTSAFITLQIDVFRQRYLREENGIYYLQVDEIRENLARNFIIFELMKPFNFSNYTDLENLLHAGSGKQLFSPTHRLIQNRNQWIITSISEGNNSEVFEINEAVTEILLPISLIFSEEKKPSRTDENTIFVDADLLEFPLKLRKWKPSDSFAPFGMQGKRKKLSKFFKDEKYSLLEKENQWLLTDCHDRIIWVVGKRPDNYFRVTLQTKKILSISKKFGQSDLKL